MTTAAAVISAGFLGSLGGIAWDVMGVIGCIVTGSVVLAVLFLTVTAPPRKPRHAPTQPSRVMPEIGDDLPFRQSPPEPGSFRADGLNEALRRIREGDRG